LERLASLGAPLFRLPFVAEGVSTPASIQKLVSALELASQS
jgi:hypothetical protein